MRRANTLVFDDIIQTGDSYTSSRHNLALGRFDNLVVQAIVDNVDTTDISGTLKIYSEISGDGRHWDAKNPGVEILAAAVTPGATTTKAATDTGMWISLACVRLRLQLLSTARARVRVYVTARDGGG